jgi:hypothetical protein
MRGHKADQPTEADDAWEAIMKTMERVDVAADIIYVARKTAAMCASPCERTHRQRWAVTRVSALQLRDPRIKTVFTVNSLSAGGVTPKRGWSCIPFNPTYFLSSSLEREKPPVSPVNSQSPTKTWRFLAGSPLGDHPQGTRITPYSCLVKELFGNRP